MLYDNNPAYPHYDALPYAKEPWKALYVLQRLFTTLVLVPIWVLEYSLLPRRFRPRKSWSLRQIINVNFTRRIHKVTEVAGVTWGTRDPTVAPDSTTLRETRFIWADPLPLSMRTGIVEGGGVEFKCVGCYVWPKEEPTIIAKAKSVVSSNSKAASPSPTSSSHSTRVVLSSNQGTEGREEIPLVGIFMHGGGYCHMSAHETSRTSRIPRGLIKNAVLHEVYSVEYRLLQVAPFPAVVQDAASVYTHVMQLYGPKRCKVVLIGDSSGGNLVLALARWIRDEGHLPVPHGLLLLSPSCDTSHNLPETLSSYIPRPNEWTDYLVDTPGPRALLQRTFLGFRGQPCPSNLEEERRLMEIVHTEYVSPCSPFVLKRWGHDVIQDPEGPHHSHFHHHVQNLSPAVRLARDPQNLASVLDSPYHKKSRFPRLFGDFPKTLVVLGDAERLVREVKSLVVAMEKDGVDVKLYVVPDGVHDVLTLSGTWWDKKAIWNTWAVIIDWGKSLRDVV